MKKELQNKWNVKCKILIVFFILSLVTYHSSLISQTLIPTAETAFENQLPFNTEYIKSQKIKSITFDIIDKKDLQVAEDKGLLTYYEFNTNGFLSRFYNTSIIKVIQKNTFQNLFIEEVEK
ncbi:MAG: hypothetical protein IPH32_12660 [Bacteroidetes bacterium]|nr:hypothetical protein [Bacteroidota bacterium]